MRKTHEDQEDEDDGHGANGFQGTYKFPPLPPVADWARRYLLVVQKSTLRRHPRGLWAVAVLARLTVSQGITIHTRDHRIGGLLRPAVVF